MTDFAVVIPTYNRPEYVVQAVESVLRQTHPAAEIVVVIDGGDADLAARLRGRGVLVVEQARAGEAAARNAGIDATTSRWICFLDDDDLWHPERLQAHARHIAEHPEARAIHSPSWVFAETEGATTEIVDFRADDLEGCLRLCQGVTPKVDWSYLDIEGRSFDLLLERNRGNTSGATIARELVERVGGFPRVGTTGSDWALFLGVARLTEWSLVDRPLSFLRFRPTTVSRAPAYRLSNALGVLRVIDDAWKPSELPRPPHRPLEAYGKFYRHWVRLGLWQALRRRRFAEGREIVTIGLRVLPRWRDRLYPLVPDSWWSAVRTVIKRPAR